MKPLIVGDLNFVKASYDSPRGEIKSYWQKKEGTFLWDITVPGNTTATVYLPDAVGKTATEGGKEISQIKDIKNIRNEGTFVVFEIGSGDYRFEVK